MTGDRSLLMDSTLRPSDKSHITFADTGKSKVLGLGRVAISKDQHMDKVMLVESLGFNLMSVSMLCDLNMIVIFGKYRCLVLMESDKSLVFEGYRKDDLYMVDFSAGPQLVVCLLAKASEFWLLVESFELSECDRTLISLCFLSQTLSVQIICILLKLSNVFSAS